MSGEMRPSGNCQLLKDIDALDCSKILGPEWEYAGATETCGQETKQVMCSHSRYLATPEECCRDGKSAESVAYTCDPIYLSNDSSCADVLKELCSVGDNLTTLERCINFCSEEVENNRDTCDTMYIDYCRKNPSDIRCGCLGDSMGHRIRELRRTMSPELARKFVCWYKPCQAADSIMTARMRNTSKQCDTVKCVIRDINISAGESSVEISNDCGVAIDDIKPITEPSALRQPYTTTFGALRLPLYQVIARLCGCFVLSLMVVVLGLYLIS